MKHGTCPPIAIGMFPIKNDLIKRRTVGDHLYMLKYGQFNYKFEGIKI